MAKAKKRLKNLKITTLSLCKRGKNGLKTVLKSQGSGATLEAPSQFLVQEDSKVKGRLLVVNVAPDLPDVDGEETEAQVILQAAHEYLRDFRQLDIEHDGKVLPKSAAYLAESFIVNEGDTRFKDWKDYDGNSVDVTGAWASVIQLNDPDLIKSYEDGDWDGISMLGTANLEVEKSQNPNAAPGGNHMTPEEIKALLDGRDEALIAKIVKALAPDPVEGTVLETIETVEAPVFKGDISNVEDVTAFQKELSAHELSTKIASGEMNSEQLMAVVKSMSAEAPSDKELGLDGEASPQERKLARELHEVRKSRNASTLEVEGTNDTEDEQELSDEDLINIGLGRPITRKEAK